MKRAQLLPGLLCLVAGQAFAAVPYTFTAGQPARASEVNANFSNLDTRVKALETSGGSGGGGSSSGGTVYAHSLTYTPQAGTAGQQITVGGTTYKLVRVPVKTPDGKVYAITYPTQLRDGGASLNASARYYISTSIYVYHVKFPFQQSTTINGFPADLNVSDYWGFNYAGVLSNPGSGNGYWDQKAVATFEIQSTVSIDLNGYRIGINYSLSEKQKEQTGIAASTSDFTGVDLTAVQDSSTLIGYLDQLVDYVKVELLP